MANEKPSLTVRQISGKTGREYLRENHYSRTCHNGPMCWGLFLEETLVGVCAFATPSSEAVRSSVFGEDHKDKVTELHRLHTRDGLPKNTESWFVAQSIRGLREYRPKLRALISFADSTEGHVGYIYQALNALYCGTTGRATFFRDPEGRLRHPRQSGVNVSREDALSWGWVPERRESKHRYVLLIGSRAQRRWARRNLLLERYDFPKTKEAVKNDVRL